MIIICDSAQQKGKHEIKHRQLIEMGYELMTLPLPVADYIIADEKVMDVIKRKQERKTPVKKMDLLGSYSVAVDTKNGIQEIISDICGKQHCRFRDELILAQNNGIKLYILIEDDGGYITNGIFNNPVRRINDLFSWKNPRLFIRRNGKQLYPSATKGSVIAKAMLTMEKEYGCSFVFCSAKDTGREITRLLNHESSIPMQRV